MAPKQPLHVARLRASTTSPDPRSPVALDITLEATRRPDFAVTVAVLFSAGGEQDILLHREVLEVTKAGKNEFHMEFQGPDPEEVREDLLEGNSLLVVTFIALGKEFLRAGFIVDVKKTSEDKKQEEGEEDGGIDLNDMKEKDENNSEEEEEEDDDEYEYDEDEEEENEEEEEEEEKKEKTDKKEGNASSTTHSEKQNVGQKRKMGEKDYPKKKAAKDTTQQSKQMSVHDMLVLDIPKRKKLDPEVPSGYTWTIPGKPSLVQEFSVPSMNK